MSISDALGYCSKNSNRGVEDTFLKTLLEFLDSSLYPKKFQRKQEFTPGSSATLCDTPWKFHKPRSMEIIYTFFSCTPLKIPLLF